MYLGTHQNLAGPGPGFDSKSEQLNSIAIQTDPASALLVRYSFGCWCDHQKCLTLCTWHALLITGVPVRKRFFEKRLAAAIGPQNFFKSSLQHGHKRDQRDKLQRCCRIRFAFKNLKTE